LKTCPPNTQFSPFSNKCDGFYKCDGIDPHGGIDPCLTFNFANPLVPNPKDKKCATYIQCQQSYNGDQINVIVEKNCPANTFYNPIIGKCYNNYNCNQNCSKDPCINGNGRFIDYKSGQCEYFIECRDTSKVQLIYEPVYEKVYCPPGLLFTPETSTCNKGSVCPKPAKDYCYPVIPTTTTTTTTTSAPGWGGGYVKIE